MKPGAKVAIALTLTAAAVAFAGGGSTSRGPYRGKILVPGANAPWDPVDESLCLCWEAGDTKADKLTRCVLARLWPEVPWPSQRGDDPTVVETEKRVRERARAFVAEIARGGKPCEGVPEEPERIDDPAVEPPRPPEDPDVEDPFSEGPATNAFGRIVKGSNPSKYVRIALGVSPNSAAIPTALRSMAFVGTNLYFYSRPRQAGTYGTARIGNRAYDIGPAWLPANEDLRKAFERGEKPLRRVSWSGNKITAGEYGTPWLPELRGDGGFAAIDVESPWDPRINPPAEVLARMGLNLVAMRTAWAAANG